MRVLVRRATILAFYSALLLRGQEINQQGETDAGHGVPIEQQGSVSSQAGADQVRNSVKGDGDNIKGQHGTNVCGTSDESAVAMISGVISMQGLDESLCEFDQAILEWSAEIPLIGQTYAGWGIAIVNEENGSIISRIPLEKARPRLASGQRSPPGLLMKSALVSDSLISWEAQQDILMQAFKDYDGSVPVVGCQVYSDWETSSEIGCSHGRHWPRMIAISASAGYGAGSNFTVKFDRNTNTPSVSSREEIEKLIEFSASIGEALQGEWVDARTLMIKVLDDSGRADYHEIGVTASLKQRPRNANEKRFAGLKELNMHDPSVLALEGSMRLRLGAPGLFRAKLYILDSETSVSESEVIRVESCGQFEENEDGATTVILPPNLVSQTTDALTSGQVPGAMSVPAPIWASPSRVATQDAKIILPRPLGSDRVAESQYDLFSLPREGGWTFTFWIALAPPGTFCNDAGKTSDANFRSLLYHGQGRGHEQGIRTPSVWLFPNGDNRITLHVSTQSNPDMGVDSTLRVPQGEWAHLALSVANKSDAFEAIAYINGQEACKLSVPQGKSASSGAAHVLPGKGNLHWLHDPWNKGPEGFVQGAAMYAQPLSRLQVLREMEEVAQHHTIGATDDRLFPQPNQIQCGQPTDQAINDEMVASALNEEDANERQALLESAAQDGDSRALVQLATDEVLLGPPSFAGLAQASEQIGRAAAMGDSDALYYQAVRPEVAQLGNAPGTKDGTGTQVNRVAGPTTYISRLERAALYGSVKAKLALAHEQRRLGKCRESLFYFQQVADAANAEHHAGGTEPLVEMQVLSDFVDEKGERGDQDEEIQYQMHLADKGDAVAQFNMGGLFYYGSRGLDRDQDRAFRYFERAASSGHAGAQTACGNMLLKGEGVAVKNTSGAMDYYSKAAEQDNLEALNGLGFLYFFGDAEAGVEKNVSKALEYFERNLRDGDSLSNAAHIYLHQDDFRDIAQARRYLEKAATTYSSFTASHQLGTLLSHTDVTLAGCRKAQQFLRQAALRASWGTKLRQGFDAYLDGDLEASAVHYAEAALLGYSRGAENAVWLLKSRMHTDHLDERFFLLMDAPIPPLQRLAQGDIMLASDNKQGAIQAWVAASVDGDWSMQPVYRSQACYNLGALAMAGGDLVRAERYFDRARSFVEDDPSEEADAARLALDLVAWRLKLARKLPAFLSPFLLNHLS